MTQPLPIVRFGDPGGPGYYDFPNTMYQFSTNLGDALLTSIRLPGVSGGWDNYGSEPAPIEIGQVRLSFYLLASNPYEMTSKRDEVYKMMTWGRQRLYMKPSDPALEERWCWAKINSIQMPQNAESASDHYQEVTIIWQVLEAKWYSPYPSTSGLWGSSFVWGTTTWGSGGVLASVSGVGPTNISVTNNGNDIAIPNIYVFTGSSQSIDSIRISRLVLGTLKDEVFFNGSLGSNQSLEIDCNSKSVKRNGVSGYSLFSFHNPAMMRLMPGTQDLSVTLGAEENACTVVIAYRNTWKV